MKAYLHKSQILLSRKFYSVANSTRSASDVRELFARIYNYNKKEKANNQQKNT